MATSSVVFGFVYVWFVVGLLEGSFVRGLFCFV